MIYTQTIQSSLFLLSFELLFFFFFLKDIFKLSFFPCTIFLWMWMVKLYSEIDQFYVILSLKLSLVNLSCSLKSILVPPNNREVNSEKFISCHNNRAVSNPPLPPSHKKHMRDTLKCSNHTDFYHHIVLIMLFAFWL